MKKMVIVVLAALSISLSLVYVLIPQQIYLQQSISIKSNPSGFQRSILNEANLHKWWPGKVISTGQQPQLLFNDFSFRIVEKRFSTLVFSIAGKDTASKALLHFITAGSDSILMGWDVQFNASLNPLHRVHTYLRAKKLEEDLQTILNKARDFFSSVSNIYGLAIKQTLVKDSILLFTAAETKTLPNNQFIYNLVNELHNYAIKNGAAITGYPMLNISTNDSVNYTTKVALPTNKKLEASGKIVNKWMLGGGKILLAEVMGGPYAINTALQQMETFVDDYHYNAPAIPFQSLVTNRLQEMDSAKWITRIYYPVR